MHDYAIEQMNRLLTTLAFQVHRAAKKPGPDEIHDLRVSIRRFSQGLQLFADFFPKWEVKKIRRMLKRYDAAHFPIRDRDITLEFLAEASRTARTGRAWRKSAAPISGSSPKWCAAGARTISQPSGGTDCHCAAYEIETFTKRRRERPGWFCPRWRANISKPGARRLRAKQPPDELHGFRLETKRFRYTLELFRPALWPESGSLLESAARSCRERSARSAIIRPSSGCCRAIGAPDPDSARAKEKVKDLRHSWRAFDSEGQLKRWRTYLAGDHSKPRASPKRVTVAKKTAAPQGRLAVQLPMLE